MNKAIILDIFKSTRISKSTGEPVLSIEELDYENMFLEGIASTDDKDVQNDVLIPKTFDLSYVLPTDGGKKGKINWNHKETEVIGQWEDAKVLTENDVDFYAERFPNQNIKAGDLWVRIRLLSTIEENKQRYKNAWQMQSDSNSEVNLSFSIEGSANKNENGDIVSVYITALALTNVPVNNKRTFAAVVKSLDLDSENIYKALDSIKELIDIDSTLSNENIQKSIQLREQYPNLTLLQSAKVVYLKSMFDLSVERILEFEDVTLFESKNEILQKAFNFSCGFDYLISMGASLEKSFEFCKSRYL